MAQVFLTSVTEDRPGSLDAHRFALRHLRACAGQDRRQQHRVSDDPAGADLILFVEGHGDDAAGEHFEQVRAAALYREHAGKCFLYSGIDRVIPFLPGIYPSIERRWSWPGWTRGGCYLVPPNPFMAERPHAVAKEHLASFFGACGKLPVRHQLMTLSDRPDFLMRNTTAPFVGAIHRGDDLTLAAFKRDYVHTSLASKFVLCPRGMGPSSIRLFESMELGVAPVVIGDDWVEPVGPRWSDFCLRVAERDVALLPALLAAREHEHQERGRRARQAWEEFYAPWSLFHTLVEDCLALSRTRRIPLRGMQLAVHAHLARPCHLRKMVRKVRATLRPAPA
jgi:hypothetical protein